MKAVENVEEILQNISGVVSAGRQYKKYVRCAVEKQCLNRIFRAYLN
ncbi:MAG TPA: hypothetical protein VFA69_00960 [Candidatus Nitrosotalea sp.]|nr:hypothetical protein [Candidatus Nitrosotalea sp.]